MKVLHVNHLIDSAVGGGTAERTFQMSRFLSDAGVRCSILTTNIGLTPERKMGLAGIEVLAYPCYSKRFYLPKFSYREIRQLIKSVDIVHLMGHWTFLNALTYLVASRMGKPYVVCPAGALPIYGRSSIPKKLYNLVVGNRIIANAAGHIAITKDEIPQFQAHSITADRVTVISNGINSADLSERDDDSFRRKYSLGSEPFILFVGRLNRIKGPDLLLKAFYNVKDELPAYHLIFAGPDGGMLAKLKELAESGLGKRVHFVGYLGGTDKSWAYHAATLLVIPSRQEAMSIVALEAGITGTPVLLTDRCGFDEIATIGGGMVVPASVEGLQKGLLDILSDTLQLKKMGGNIEKYVRENFTWDSVINKYLQLYRQILNEKK